MTRPSLVLGLLLVAWLLLRTTATPSPAHAVTFAVADGDVGGLIEALSAANGNGRDDVIELAAGGTYTLTEVDNTTDGDNGLPSIQADGGHLVTITGNGASIGRAGDAPAFRILYISEGAELRLSDLTISGGHASGTYEASMGGGILNGGQLSVTDVTIAGNDADLWGGGIFNAASGTLTVADSALSGNSAIGGGAIMNALAIDPATSEIIATGRVTLSNSSLVDNHGDQRGGGIDNDGIMTITGSLLSANRVVSGGGGAIANIGTLTITDSTISGNRAPTAGGISNGGILTLANSTISTNTSDPGAGGGVSTAGTLTAIGTVFSSNRSTDSGAGIYSTVVVDQGNRIAGTLTLTDAILIGNRATRSGGALYNEGAVVTIDRTVFSGNAAGSWGGGIFNTPSLEPDLTVGGAIALSRSTLSGNSATNVGGAIFNGLDSTIAITNSTLSGNGADFGGGIAISQGTVTLSSTTISGNRAFVGSGVRNELGTVTTANTIVAGGLDGGNCGNEDGAFVGVAGSNLSDDHTCPGPLFTQVSDVLLGPLQDNGGPTETHAPLRASPAVDAGHQPTCDGINPNVDQRGFPRTSGARCDIGAVELQPARFRAYVAGAAKASAP